ncbi:MAG: hypothetical protein ACJ8CR_25540 [Roseiflexaceae bacterium]
MTWAPRTSPPGREKLFQTINRRYNAALPIVITCNRPLEDLDGQLAFVLGSELALVDGATQ